jgi:type I restriction enzyme S subunit
MTAELRRLDEVCTITMGQAPSGDSYNDRSEGLPLIAGAGDFSGDRPRVKKYTTAPSKSCAPGDIVLGIRASIGAKVWADREYCLGRGVAGLRPSPVLHDRYLWHWLTNSAATLSAKGRGATFLQVNRKDISELQIPMPPLDEQRRIAAILDQADVLRAKRREALIMLPELTRAVYAEMVPEDARLVPLGTALSSAAVFTDGDWVESKDQDPDGEVRLTQLADVGDNAWLDKSSRFLTLQKAADLRCTFLQRGDVLVARMPDPLGRACVFPGDEHPCVTVVDVCVIRPDPSRFTSQWLAACINSEEVRRQIARLATGTTRSRVSRGNLKNVLIPDVPLDVQRMFSRRVAEIFAARERMLQAARPESELSLSLRDMAFKREL